MVNTLVNGIAYSFVDITIRIVGISDPLVGFEGVPIKSINYSAKQNKVGNQENSHYITSYSYGAKTYGGNMGLTLDAAEQLRDSIYALGLTERSICAMPALDMTITCAVKGKANTTTLKNVVFTSEDMSGSQGNDTLSVSCEFICSHIDFGDIMTPQAGVDLVYNMLGQDQQNKGNVIV